MDARAKTVGEILHSGDQYIIPFFQRYYSWKKDNWQRLADDLTDLLEDNDSRQHFMGPLVCTPIKHVPGEVNGYQLIDGQQRLTTITLALAALRDVATSRGFAELSSEIAEDYLLHHRMEGLSRYKVIPRLGDREALIDIIEGNAQRKYKETKVDEAWQFYRKRFHEMDGSQERSVLKKMLVTITAKLSLVVITVDGENPYEIFESLNSTGLPLEESDLIRNYLFMQVPLEQQDAFFAKHWELFERAFANVKGSPEMKATPFYRSYLMRSGVYSKAKATFVDFKEQNRKSGMSPEVQVAELRRFVEYETMLRRPQTVENAQLRTRLEQIDSLDIKTVHPLLMALLELRAKNVVGDDELGGCLDDLASFAIRRTVCNESTKPYTRWFPEAIRELGDEPRKGLQQYLLRRGWPDDDTFRSRLVDFPIYRRERPKCELVLQSLERSYGHKEKVDLQTLTIEHLMPQSIGDGQSGSAWKEMLGEQWETIYHKWLHTLGNLTLSGYNPSLGNRPFDQKRQKLLESNLVLNRYFASTEVWNEDAIRTRGGRLAEEIVKLWPRPEGGSYVPSPEEENDTESEEPARERRLTRYWTRFAETVQELSPTLKPVEVGPRTWVMYATENASAELWAWERRGKMIAVVLSFRTKVGKNLYRTLKSNAAEINQQLGSTVEWHDDDWWIIASKAVRTIRDEVEWPAQHRWLAERIVKFTEVLVPRLKVGQMSEEAVEA